MYVRVYFHCSHVSSSPLSYSSALSLFFFLLSATYLHKRKNIYIYIFFFFLCVWYAAFRSIISLRRLFLKKKKQNSLHSFSLQSASFRLVSVSQTFFLLFTFPCVQMSGTLLHRAPSHQPPPPSASKSRSRDSCHIDDGVPNLHLNTAHYTGGGVVEVRVGPHRDPTSHFDRPSCFLYADTKRPCNSQNATTTTSALLHRPLPTGPQRSRLEAEEDALLDSLSFSEAPASPDAEEDAVPRHAYLHEVDSSSTVSSVVFDGHDEEQKAPNSDVVSTLFCLPSTGGVERAADVSSTEQSPVFYEEEEKDGRNDGCPTSESLRRRLHDRTATPRGAVHAAAHRPLDLEEPPQHTSRKLIYSASAVLTSPLENAASGNNSGNSSDTSSNKAGLPRGKYTVPPPPSLFGYDDDDEGNASSSPQLRHNHLPSGDVEQDGGGARACPARMVPLVPPTLVEKEGEDAGSPDVDKALPTMIGASAGREAANRQWSSSSHDRAASSTAVGANAALGSPLPHLPPTPHTDLDRADAEMESAMQEIAARLRDHDRSVHPLRAGPGGGGSGGYNNANNGSSDGVVLSKGNSPSTPRASTASSPSSAPRFHAQRTEHKDDIYESLASDVSDAPHLMHSRGGSLDDGLVDDPEEAAEVGNINDAHLVESVCEEAREKEVDGAGAADNDLLCQHALMKSPSEGSARGLAAPVSDANPAGYTFFSSQLPPPVDRRAHIYELAKILREGEALLTSQSNEERSKEGEDEGRQATGKTANMRTAAGKLFTMLPPVKEADNSAGEAMAAATAGAYTYPRANTDSVSAIAADGSMMGEEGLSSSQAQVVGSGTPASPHTASIDAAAAELNFFSASLSASTSRRHRPPPRLLCPPTPSPSRSRAEEGKEADASPEPSTMNSHSNAHSVAGVGTARGAPQVFSFHNSTVPLVMPFSASAVVTLNNVAVPFSSNTSAFTCLAPATVERSASSTLPSSTPADLNGDDGNDGDSTASVLTAVSDAEKRDLFPCSALGGLTDASVCAAEEGVPAPLSPRCDREPSLRACRSSLPRGEVEVAGAHEGLTSAAAFHRTDRETRRGADSRGFGISSKGGASTSTPTTRAAVVGDGGGSGSGTSLIARPSTVRRSLARLPSREKQTGNRDPFSSPLSQRTSSHPLMRRSTAAGAAVVASEKWSTVDELDDMEEEEHEKESTSDHVVLPPCFSSEGSPHRQCKSPASDTSSPLPVRPTDRLPTLPLDDADEENSEEAHLMYGMGPDTQAMKDKSRATWQSEASSDGLFDDEEDDGDAHTSMEEMLQRAEGKTAVLRLELAAATDRATTAEDALRVKEEECTELHALVDRLQAELAAACESGRAAAAAAAAMADATATPATPPWPLRVDAEVQAAVRLPAPRMSPAVDSPAATRAEAVTPQGTSADETNTAAEKEWRRRYDTVALELAAVKTSTAEQLAVLDRLGLRPPFTEDVICAAQRRLRRVRVANAPAPLPARKTGDAAESSNSPAVTGVGVKMRVGEKKSILALLAQRKQQQQAAATQKAVPTP